MKYISNINHILGINKKKQLIHIPGIINGVKVNVIKGVSILTLDWKEYTKGKDTTKATKDIL